MVTTLKFPLFVPMARGKRSLAIFHRKIAFHQVYDRLIYSFRRWDSYIFHTINFILLKKEEYFSFLFASVSRKIYKYPLFLLVRNEYRNALLKIEVSMR